MSEINLDSCVTLINRFLEGEMTREEATLFMTELERHTELEAFFRNNVLLDFLLHELAHSRPFPEENILATAEEQDESRFYASRKEDIFTAYAKAEKSKQVLFIHPLGLNSDTRFVHGTVGKWIRSWCGMGRRNGLWITLLVVGVLCLLGCSWLIWGLSSSSDDQCQRLACVSELVDPVWPKDQEPLARGENLPPGKVNLDSGLVKLTFANGAEFIVEGPAELAIRDEMKIFCNLGKISATVPKNAVGFEVETPSSSVIDRGTRFFLEVRNNDVNVVTMEGLVDFKMPHIVVPLRLGESCTFDGREQSVMPSELKEKYIDQKQFERRLTDYVIREEKKSQEAATLEKAEDTELLAFFSARSSSNGTIANESVAGAGVCSDLKLIRCNIGEGRWFGTKGIEIRNRNSWAEFEIPGEYETLTLSTSVYIRSLSRGGNIIATSSEFLERPGAFRWQITEKGEMFFYITTEPNKTLYYQSPPIPRLLRGGWYNLTVKADPQKKRISHYIDGRLMASQPWENPVPIYVGTCIIGNSNNLSLNRDMYLNGCFDDFKVRKSTKGL